MYLLDTDHITDLQRKPSSEFSERIKRDGAHLFYASVVSFHEQTNGWNAYLHRETSEDRVLHGYHMFRKVLEYFSRMQVIEYDRAAAENLKTLRTQGVRIGLMDLRIAATALSREFTLLTNNSKDFSKVPGLKIESWTAETGHSR